MAEKRILRWLWGILMDMAVFLAKTITRVPAVQNMSTYSYFADNYIMHIMANIQKFLSQLYRNRRAGNCKSGLYNSP